MEDVCIKRCAHFAGDISINDGFIISYEGQEGRKKYALTITSRKMYRHPREFREDLYKFLREINYKFKIKAVMEYHDKSYKIHAHGIAYGNPPIKNNKNNPFTLRQTEVNQLNGWINYCVKSIEHTFNRVGEDFIGDTTTPKEPYIIHWD